MELDFDLIRVAATDTEFAIQLPKRRFFTRALSAGDLLVMFPLRAFLRRCWAALTSKSAPARGLALLSEWLSPEQRDQFDATKAFDVVGSHTGKRYRIRYGTATNVFEIDGTATPVIGLCFLPSGGLVAGDVMLAQKITLETDECAALLVAHRFSVNIPRRIPHRPRRVG